ncbi:MAG: cbb3-type cytochrome c oxidase subunit II [Phycisphaeraceae bacterium]|nr:cbb3-type cytochrome c oxidase subunit II [Phycisphaeraceae bacterium]
MERFKFVFLVAGLGFFALSFAVSAVLPMLPVKDMQVQTVEQLADHVPVDFAELREQYPEAFRNAFGDKNDHDALEEALVVGHAVYIAEACWHCHSQQVRPWGGDEARFGEKAYPEEYHNVLNMPPLWGTRRVGPDLSRQAGVHSNDWHVAHFYHPPDVAPWSVMPSYPWLFEDDGLTPNKKGLSLIAYVQWLGSWQRSKPVNIYQVDSILRANPSPMASETSRGGSSPKPQPKTQPEVDTGGY